MGARGPVPKRSDQRVRRNKESVPEKLVVVDFGPGQGISSPELGLDDPHPIVSDFWQSLGESAQAKFYEPSDWAFARLVLHMVDHLVRSERPSAQMMAAVNSALGDLLVSEGARRRVRLEIERAEPQPERADIAAEIQRRLSSG